ncbi:TlpA disulfide reductase family protein [Chitinophaga sp.]|uniref:TlpA disulfide reductase family protein n=1 Tax=Chitinophaga sp. TaxID=1869181 RepID=UPI002C1F1B76|nr:TlpA disulfide reductase family protein [Chitinophaga sp.]HWV65480.1 TlpA disulfide reductase family protein [Chitinophaga sp.]
MKKIICVLSLPLVLSQLVIAQQKFSIAGTVTGNAPSKYYLQYSNGTKYVTDSAEVKNGRFSFAGTLLQPAPGMVSAALIRNMTGNKKEQASLFLEPAAMTINIANGDLSTIVMKGSVSNDENVQLEKEKEAATEKYKPLLEALRNEKDHDKAGAIREQLAPYFNTNSQLSRKFIREHHNSFLSLYLMRFEIGSMTLDSARYYYNSLNAALQKSKDGLAIAKEIKSLEQGSPGSVAFNFSKKDINDQSLSLSDFKGKYVLVDFWASWCVPCRAGNPHLLELYKQYKEKGFEVISVSDDDRNHDAWKKAVEKDGIGVWKHVLRGLDMDKRMKNEPNPEDISEHFGIHSLPTQILIDPKGVIIARYGGGGEEHEALDAKLKEVFNN